LQKAKTGSRCDYALFVGASSDNYSITREIAPHAAALKMYLNETFTTLRLTDLTVWIKVNGTCKGDALLIEQLLAQILSIMSINIYIFFLLQFVTIGNIQ